jgi:hypothetical protein
MITENEVSVKTNARPGGRYVETKTISGSTKKPAQAEQKSTSGTPG